MAINILIFFLLLTGLLAVFAANPITGLCRALRTARGLFGAGKLKRGQGT